MLGQTLIKHFLYTLLQAVIFNRMSGKSDEIDWSKVNKQIEAEEKEFLSIIEQMVSFQEKLRTKFGFRIAFHKSQHHLEN